MSNTQSKKWYASKTIWGVVIMLIATIMNYFGLPVDTIDQSMLVNDVTTIAVAVGGVLATYGRVKAKAKITK